MAFRYLPLQIANRWQNQAIVARLYMGANTYALLQQVEITATIAGDSKPLLYQDQPLN